MTTPIQARIFQCAVELLGGRNELCARLGVSQRELSLWMANQETPPLPAFFGALDVILASDEGFAAIFTTRAGALH